MANFFWQRNIGGIIHIGLTAAALQEFGQIWAIIPTSERKRNYKEGDPILAIEGSDAMSAISAEFPMTKITFNGPSMDRPDELTPETTLLFAEAT